jgi:hypothetical protein
MFFLQKLVNKFTDPSSSQYSASTDTVSSTASSTFLSTSNSSAFENFTRTIRGYVPASIIVPTSEPSPPLVSIPMSYGLFSSSLSPLSRQRPPQEHRRVAGQQEFEREYERQDDSDDNSSRGYGQHLLGSAGHQPQFSSITNVPPLEGQHALRVASSGLAQAMQRSVHLQKSAPEPISWARWDIFCERYTFYLLLLPLFNGIWLKQKAAPFSLYLRIANLGLLQPDLRG